MAEAHNKKILVGHEQALCPSSLQTPQRLGFLGAGSLRSAGAVEAVVAALVEMVVVVVLATVLEVVEEAVGGLSCRWLWDSRLRTCDILCLFGTELPDFVKEVPVAIGRESRRSDTLW